MRSLIAALIILGFSNLYANPIQCFDNAVRTRGLTSYDALYLCGGANGMDPLLCYDIARTRGLVVEEATSLCRKGSVAKTIHCFDVSANRELSVRDRLILCRE